MFELLIQIVVGAITIALVMAWLHKFEPKITSGEAFVIGLVGMLVHNKAYAPATLLGLTLIASMIAKIRSRT